MNELKDFFKCFYPHDSSIEDWFTIPNSNQDELGGEFGFLVLRLARLAQCL